jgi:hypothetical protein
MKIIFTCGCEGTLSGVEQDLPLCPKHQMPVRRIIVGKPIVRGTVQSPLKEGSDG